MPLGVQENGINKVLCMKNGSTMLFHFENNKEVKVFVFDSLHNRVATMQQPCNLLDISMLSTSTFKGVLDVGGEGVLFIEQQNSGRHALLRLRYNGTTGRLIDETSVAHARSLAKPSHFFVTQAPSGDGYMILLAEDIPQFKKCNIRVAYYNDRHERVKEVPLLVARKKYDYLHIVGLDATTSGLCVSIGLSNMVLNGTGSAMQSMPIYHYYMQVFYVPNDSVTAMQRTIDLSSEIPPSYTTSSYNPFAGTINLMLLSFRDVVAMYGIMLRPTAFLSNILYRFDEHTFNGDYTWIGNKLAHEKMKQSPDDTGHLFVGLPIRMFTNENGLSTIISQAYHRDLNSETYYRNRVFETFLGDICVTQVDDEGKELWGTILPVSQYYYSYRHYYHPTALARRGQHLALFNDLPPQITERQFMSANVCSFKDNYYVIYNDCDNNIRHADSAAVTDTVYSSSISNACYYRISRKHEVTKHFLYGEPLFKEYKSSYVEGAAFDEKRGTYVSVIRYKRGQYVSIRLAWAQLD